MYYILFFCLLSICFNSCTQKQQTDPVVQVVNDWRGKEIKFPEDIVYTIQGLDTVSYSTADKQYKILTYIDQNGCTSCKLKIDEWKHFINYLDSATNKSVGYIFLFYPQKLKDIRIELHAHRFTQPVYIDMNDKMNQLNHFPDEFDFQTFLLDKHNKVITIGNPINNAAIKELYINTILKRAPIHHQQTEVSVSTYSIDLGNIPSTKPTTTSFQIQNTGNNPFVLLGINTSCGCTTTQYTREPINKDTQTTVKITYTPKGTGVFNESLIIRGNISTPIKISIKGIVDN